MYAIVAAAVSGSCTLAGVFLANRMQARRIDADNRAALAAQTEQIKTHVAETVAPKEAS